MPKKKSAGSKARSAKVRKTAARKSTSTKRAQPPRAPDSAPSPAPATSDAVSNSEGGPSSPRLARVVGITPQDRVLPGYREFDVRAIQPGTYAGRSYRAGDVFRIALQGEGEPPTWVRPVG